MCWPDETWAPTWFPLAAMPGEDRLAITCDVPDGAPAPVRQWDTESCGARINAPSLTDTVAAWVHILDERIVYWNGRYWALDGRRLTNDLSRRSGSAGWSSS